jgi:CRISPR-associated exonuclease Cas4
LGIKFPNPELSHSGSQVNYYFVCKRKLWLFSHNIELESDSDLVLQGKLLHENSYKRKLKEIDIGNIKIDFIEKLNEVHEIKRSRKIEDAHKYQLLYYLYYLKKYADIKAKGILNYPLLKQTILIKLTPTKEKEIQRILNEVDQIIESEKPPLVKWIPYCKSCAYSEMCWG